MIAGCYDLHLYCDAPGCRDGDFERHPKEGEFTGDETGGRARARARARDRGWLLNMKDGTCVCPGCADKGRRKGHRP